MALPITKIGRIPQKVESWENGLGCRRQGRCPFLDAAIGAFTVGAVETGRGTVVGRMSSEQGERDEDGDENEMGGSDLWDGMPVLEPDVGAARVSSVVRVKKEAQFRLRRKSSALGLGVHEQAVIRGRYWPVLGDAHRYRSIQLADLSSLRLNEHSWGDQERKTRPRSRRWSKPNSAETPLATPFQNARYSPLVTGRPSMRTWPTSTRLAGFSLSHPNVCPATS